MKRLRVGDRDEADEFYSEIWHDGFIGTMYEDFRDIERRRKMATSCSTGDECLIANKEGKEKDVCARLDAAKSPNMAEEDPELRILNVYEDGDDSLKPKDDVQPKTPSFLPTEIEGKSTPQRICAVFDGSASPRPSPRRRSGQDSEIVDFMEAPARAKQTAGEQQKHTLNIESGLGQNQAVVISPDKAYQLVEGGAKEVLKISSLDGGDDTEYLHAFLTRAKAKKAARTKSPEKDVDTKSYNPPACSPQTQSRTALASLDSNSPSPKKMNKHEGSATSPTRRSSRTRLPRPERHQPAIPNSIPFRRSNGTEFIFLQKTEAQQVAMATRSNTRKNKGEALEPKMKLEALSSKTQPSPAKVLRKRKNNKQVSWDEGLAYFASEKSQSLDNIEERQTQKTPVKRSRRLAPRNGTPAPKRRMAEASQDVEAPISRSRTRSSGKIRET